MKDGELEELDIEILRILSEKGRSSHRFIAEKLGKSHLTIKKHIDELEKNKVIKGYSADIDFEKLGYDIIALIEITVSKGKMLEVENKLAQNPNVFAVYDITGTYDALILAKFKTRAELSDMIKEEIHTSPFVERTNTHIVLNIIKEKSSLTELINQK
ncbi:MAG: Lrp/AsnC family transcriptional regulator [Promethearchaeota archaeon]|jgi:DNA-binding Lrp family transcriptional regulator